MDCGPLVKRGVEKEALGFRFEPFGQDAVRITATPETVIDPETALLAEWSVCQFRDVCPHGRAIVKRLSLADLLHEFGRI